MEKKVYQPSETTPLSRAVFYNGLWYVSGQVGVDPATGKVAEGDVAAQTAQTLENIKQILEEVGSSLDRVIKTTVFLTDVVKDFQTMNEVYRRYFPKDPPARSTIGVAALARPELLVEIECIAAPKE